MVTESPEYMQTLREASFDQLIQPLRARVNALQTNILASLTDEDCRTVMTALASGDYVMVGRERFERMRTALIAAQRADDRYGTAYLPSPEEDEDNAVRFSIRQDKRRQALMALEPTDTDPLP